MSLIVVHRKGDILWEGGVYSGRVANRCLKGGIFSEGGVDSGSVKYSCRNGVTFWDGGVDSRSRRNVIYSQKL